jgi:hypothetical protein
MAIFAKSFYTIIGQTENYIYEPEACQNNLVNY